MKGLLRRFLIANSLNFFLFSCIFQGTTQTPQVGKNDPADQPSVISGQPTQSVKIDTPRNLEKITLENIQYLQPADTPSHSSSKLIIQGDVYKATFSKDNSLLAVCTTAGIGVYDILSGTEKWFESRVTGECLGLEFSSSGEYLLFTKTGTIWTLKADTGERIAWQESSWSAFFSPDDKYIFTTSPLNPKILTVLNWNLEPIFTLEAPSGFINNTIPAFSPDGTVLATIAEGIPGSSSMILLWDMNTHSLKGTFAVQTTLSEIRFANDGQSLFLVTRKGDLERWSLDGSFLNSYSLEQPYVVSGRNLSDFGEVYAGNITQGGEIQFTVLDTSNRSVLYTRPQLDKFFSLSPDGNYLAIASDQIEIINLRGSNSIEPFGSFTPSSRLGQYVVSPDGIKVAFYSYKSCVIWDLLKQKKIDDFEIPFMIRQESGLFDSRSMLFNQSSDSLFIITSPEGTNSLIVYEYDLNTHELNQIEDELITPSISSFAVNPRGKLIALPEEIPGWLASIPKEEQTYSYVMEYKWSPDFSRMLFVSVNGYIYLWDWENQQLIKKFQFSDYSMSSLYDIYFSPDEKSPLLLFGTSSGGKDQSFHVLDLLSEQVISLPPGSPGLSSSPYFFPDGSSVAYTDCGGLKIYPIQGGNMVQFTTNLGCGLSVHLVLDDTGLLAVNSDSMQLWTVQRP